MSHQALSLVKKHKFSMQAKTEKVIKQTAKKITSYSYEITSLVLTYRFLSDASPAGLLKSKSYRARSLFQNSDAAVSMQMFIFPVYPAVAIASCRQ